MAAPEYTLTRATDTVTTSSTATRDYLVTQGWTVSSSTPGTEPGGDVASLEAQLLEEIRKRTFDTERQIIPNGDFEGLFSGTAPIQVPYPDWRTIDSWGSRTFTGPDTVEKISGTQSFKMAWSGLGGLDLATPSFQVRPGQYVNLEWWTRHETGLANHQSRLQTTDGRAIPNYGVDGLKTVSTGTVSGLSAGVWRKYTAQFQVGQGQWVGKIHMHVEPSNTAIGSANIDGVRVWLSEANADITTPWRHEAWIAPTLTSPFVNYGDIWESSGYRKVAGVVYLRGLLNTTGAAAGSSTIFTLPIGYRPSGNSHVLIATGVSPWSTLLNVMSTGVVRVNQPIGAGQWLSLANVQFPVDG